MALGSGRSFEDFNPDIFDTLVETPPRAQKVDETTIQQANYYTSLVSTWKHAKKRTPLIEH